MGVIVPSMNNDCLTVVEGGIHKFEVVIECYSCESNDCYFYIKATANKPGATGILHECPHEIRFQCRGCGIIVDVESD